MKSLSLAFKINTTFIILSTVIISFLYIVFYNLFEDRMMQSEREKAVLIAQTIEPLVSMNYFLNITENIDTLAANTVKHKLISSMEIIINDKKVWFSQLSETGEKILVKYPIKDTISSEIIGSINIHYNLDNFHQSFEKIRSKIRNYLVFLGLLFIAIAFYTRHLLKPFSQIAQKVKNYQVGTELDFSSIKVERETAAIINAFESMLLTIGEHTLLLERYKQSVDESAIVAKIDLNTVITYVNDEFSRLSGYSREELIGIKYNTIFHQDVEKNIFEELSNTLDSKQIWRGTIIHNHKDGTPFYVKTTIVPILDKNHNLIEYVSISSDITELEKTRKDVEMAAKVKGEFLANMSHEIRTPMNGILGFTKLLQDTSLDKKQQEYLDIIDGSTNSLLGIINDILDISKLESGKFELDVTQVNPFIEFKKTASLFMAKAKEKNITFKVIVDPKVSKCISIDLLRIQQIVSNLISNAIKFTPIEGNITLYIKYIDTLNDKMKIRIGVKDSGIGIPKDKQQQIFEAFSQADSSTTRQFGGTGLGLSISAHLVSLMDGMLNVESLEGLGSDFFFEIPVDICESKHSKENPSLELNIVQDMDSRKKTYKGDVLIAEDNLVNQILIKEILSGFNIEPLIVSNGEEAVESALKMSFDLILMDINMPVMDGVEALNILKGQNVKTPIVALTANAMAEDKENLLKKGFDNYLSKPIVLDNLNKVLDKYLTHSNSEIKNEEEAIITNKKQSEPQMQEESKKHVDVKFIEEELNIPKEVINMLLEAYLEECESQMQALQKSIDELDFKTIAFAAHSIKGASANLRITSIEETSKIIEDKAKQEDKTDLTQTYKELVEMMLKVETEIKAL